MNIKDILIEFMKVNGFTSIVNPDIECGCGIDDLCPCDCIDIEDCQFGYTKKCDLIKCDQECDNKDFDNDICFTLEKPCQQCLDATLKESKNEDA